jgi:hypothetical protein
MVMLGNSTIKMPTPSTPIPRVLENESESAVQTTKARTAEVIIYPTGLGVAVSNLSISALNLLGSAFWNERRRPS